GLLEAVAAALVGERALRQLEREQFLVVGRDLDRAVDAEAPAGDLQAVAVVAQGDARRAVVLAQADRQRTGERVGLVRGVRVAGDLELPLAGRLGPLADEHAVVLERERDGAGQRQAGGPPGEPDQLAALGEGVEERTAGPVADAKPGGAV